MKSTILCPKCLSKRVTFDRLKVFLVCVESDGTELEIAKSVPNIEKNFYCTECGNNFEEHNYLDDIKLERSKP